MEGIMKIIVVEDETQDAKTEEEQKEHLEKMKKCLEYMKLKVSSISSERLIGGDVHIEFEGKPDVRKIIQVFSILCIHINDVHEEEGEEIGEDNGAWFELFFSDSDKTIIVTEEDYVSPKRAYIDERGRVHQMH